MPKKHGSLSQGQISIYIFRVVVDWNDSKVATGHWDSFWFLNAPFPHLSKKPTFCNPNEGGDSELPKFGVQTKCTLSTANVEHHFSWIPVCCLSLIFHIIVKRCLTWCLNVLVLMIMENIFRVVEKGIMHHNTFLVHLAMMLYHNDQRNRVAKTKQWYKEEGEGKERKQPNAKMH